jgi:hypothetical protein
MIFPVPGVSLEFRAAYGRAELTRAFELVYRTYVSAGHIAARPGGIVYKVTFGLPSSRTLVALKRSEIVGTVTLVGDNPLDLDLAEAYPEKVQSLRNSHRHLAEITCLAVERETGFRRCEVFFGLTRLLIHYAFWRRYDDLLIAIHPRHLPFYRRSFGAVPLGAVRRHAWVTGNPAMGCRIRLDSLQKDADPELWRQYFSQQIPETYYSGPPINQQDHKYFCRRAGIPSQLKAA